MEASAHRVLPTFWYSHTPVSVPKQTETITTKTEEKNSVSTKQRYDDTRRLTGDWPVASSPRAGSAVRCVSTGHRVGRYRVRSRTIQHAYSEGERRRKIGVCR
eukprot:1551425-Rhodomonas_salina.1